MNINNKISNPGKIAITCLSLCFAILFQNCKTTDKVKKEAPTEPKTSVTELAINKAAKGAYDVWYVAKGNTPNFSKYKDFYTSTALMKEIGRDSIVVSHLADHVEEFKKAFEAGYLSSFDEREIGAETTYFGNVAHRISYHIYHTNSNDSITDRAVNSIQLVNINGVWKVQTIFRQMESDSYQLPKKYDSFK